MTFRRLMLLTAVCPLLFALPGNQDLIVRTNVHMVEVSIVATDTKGAPATGLEANDIRVWDNGKEQTVASFRSVSSATPSTMMALPPGTFSNRIGDSSQIGKGAQPQTLLIVLLDAKNTKFRYQATVREAVEKVLGQKPPEQRIALYALGARLDALHDFSADKESLLAKLHEYRGEVPQYDDSIYDFGFAEMRRYPRSWYPPPAAQAAIDRTRILETLKALEAIATHMKGVPGRKNLLWISGGIARAVDGMGQRTGTGQISRRSPYYEDLGPEMKHAVAALSDANVVVYTVDARGLPAGEKSKIGDVVINIDAMREIADATGGKAFYNNNDLALGVRSALEDSREVYELTYSPEPMVANGTYHAIRLVSSRPGVQVRYRQGYNAPGKDETGGADTGDRLTELVSSPLDASEIGITASLESAAGLSLHIVVHVDPADVNLSPNGGTWSGALRLEAMQLGANGELLGGIQQTAELNLEAATYHRALQQGLPIDMKFQRATDAVAVRIGVVDERGDRVGSVSVALSPQ